MNVRPRHIAALFLCFLLLLSTAFSAQPTEQSFCVPLGQYFVLDQHAGPAVRMRVGNVDATFVDMNYTDEFGRGWSVRAAKHNSVEGREANLTLLYRHAATGYEVYFLNTLATPNGQATVVTRKYQ